MLEALPARTKIEQEAGCARCGIPYDPDCAAYQALSDGALVGICQFRFDGDAGLVRHLAAAPDPGVSSHDREERLVSLGRAVLHFLDRCGARVVRFEEGRRPLGPREEGLLRAVGFARDASGRLSVDLNAFPAPAGPD